MRRGTPEPASPARSACRQAGWPSPARLSVSVLPRPPAGSDGHTELLARLPVVAFAGPETRWRQVDLVDVTGAERAVRTAGIEQIRTADGRAVLVASMQLFVPLATRQILLVCASSPCILLADELLELFDAVLSTFELSDEDVTADAVGAR